MRIPPLTIKNTYKTTQDVDRFLSETIPVNFEICPFTVILGSLNTTQTGYKNVYSNPNDYTSFSKVFSGEEAIVAEWDNSYTLSQNNPPLTENAKPDVTQWNGTKHFQIGTILNGLLNVDNIGIDFTPSAQNANFTQEQVVKTVTLVIKNDGNNSELFADLPRFYFKLYQIPRLNIEIPPEIPTGYSGVPIKRNPTLNVDKQWYYIQSADITWNKSTRKIAYATFTFTSLNDKLATSGLAINQYVQTGGPGEPTALPTINEDLDNIQLDNDFLNPLPITHFQVTFYGFAALSSVVLMGRPIDVGQVNQVSNYRIDAPREVYLFDGQAPVYDNLSLKGIPSNNYYWSYGIPTLDTYYKDWRMNLAQNQLFDETNQKIFAGHWRDNKEMTRATNKLNDAPMDSPAFDDPNDENYFESSSRFKNYWDPAFALDVSGNNEKTYEVYGNRYFSYTNPDDSTKTIGALSDNKFKYSDMAPNNAVEVSRLMLFNHFLNATTYEIPLTIHQTTPITLNSLPVVGSFLNKMFCGIPVGYKVVNSDTPYVPSFYVLWNTEMYNVLVEYLYAVNSGGKYDGILPFNVFDNTADRIAALSGTYATNTAFAFDLTDQLMCESYNVSNGNGNVDLNQISSVKLNQVEYSDAHSANIVYLANEKTILQGKPNAVIGYVIDAIKIQSLGQVKYRLDFFSKTNKETANTPIDYDTCVYSGTYQSFSFATKYTRLWTELKQLSNPLFNFAENFNYPRAVLPPSPANSNEIRRALNLKVTKKPDWNTDIKDGTWDNNKKSTTYANQYDFKADSMTKSQDFFVKNALPVISGYTPVSLIYRLSIASNRFKVATDINNQKESYDFVYTDNFTKNITVDLTTPSGGGTEQHINQVGHNIAANGGHKYGEFHFDSGHTAYYWNGNYVFGTQVRPNLSNNESVTVDLEHVYNHPEQTFSVTWLSTTQVFTYASAKTSDSSSGNPISPDNASVSYQSSSENDFEITLDQFVVTYHRNS